MGQLQAALDKEIKETPRLLLRQLVSEKLTAASVPITNELVERLTQHILAGNPETFQWEDGSEENKSVRLDLSEKEISDKVINLINKLPSIIDALSQRAA